MTPEIPQAPDQVQEIARSIQSIEAMSGYLAGMAGKEAVNIALSNGRVNPSPEDMVSANDYGNRLGDTDPVTPAEEAMFDAAGQLAANGVELRVSKVNLSPEYKIGDQSNDQVVGFLLGYLAQSPTLYSKQREAIIAQGPEETRPKGEGMSRVKSAVEYCLGEIEEGKAPIIAVLPSVPREFGLRDAITKLANESPEEKSRLLRLLQGEEAQISETIEPVQETLDEDVTAAYESPAQVSDESEAASGEVLKSEIEAVADEIGEEAVEQVVEAPVAVEPEEVVPEPTTESGEEAVLAEEPPEINPEVQDPGEIDISQIVQSGANLQAALRDYNIAPELKKELRKMVEAWQELEHSEIAKKLWDEAIKPNLENFDSNTLTAHISKVRDLREGLATFGTKFGTLRDAISEGEMAHIADVVRRGGVGSQTFAELDTLATSIANDETTQRLAANLGLETEDAAILVKRLGNKIDGVSIDDVSADRLAAELQERGIVKLRQLFTATGDFRESQTFTNWRSISDSIEDVVRASRSSVRLAEDGTTGREVKLLRDEFQDFDAKRTNRNRMSLDPEQADRISRLATKIAQELEYSERLARLSKNESDWLLNK